MKIGIGFDKYFDKVDQYTEGDCMATFEKAVGLEGENILQAHSDDEVPINVCEVTFINCDQNESEFMAEFRHQVETKEREVSIYIISTKNEILSTNHISDVDITYPFKDENNNLNLTIDGWLAASEKGFFEIAERYLDYGISELGTWKALPSDKVHGWLEAAVKFHSNRNDVSGKTVSIDSDGLDSEYKFHCALGEAVNGPLGYFGRGLDGLSDCFCGDFGVRGNFTLNWRNHKEYKKRFPDYFFWIVDVFRSGNQTINLL